MAGDPVKHILKGDVRALASLMSLIEDGEPQAKAVLRAIYPYTGRAHIIGVTGAAGTGKSSLIDRMTAEYRRRQKSLGILAVDPSSLFSTGALLGDRIRMREHFLDDRVFIRSFATRGSRGGLSAAVRDAIHLLDAAGKEVILVETIGAGQDQLEIAALADAVLVVVIPQMGDEVQALKAGLAEITDILVVTKADLPGAEEAIQQLRFLFDNCVVVPTSAVKNEGIGLLVDTIEQHRSQRLRDGKYQTKRFELCRQELLSLLRDRVVNEVERKLNDDVLAGEVRRIAERQVDPYTAVEGIAKKIGL